MFRAVLGCGAMPVLSIGRNAHRVAGADLADRTAPGLHPSDAGIKKPGVAAGPDIDEVLRAALG